MPSSGSGEDHLCQWLYETFQSSDPDLKLIVLSFIPLISSLYLSRVISSPYSSSLAGFESVILTIYQSETRLRGGKPLLISIPDLSQPSLYHTPRPGSRNRRQAVAQERQAKVGVLSPPLEPQMAVKSTKRACIVAVGWVVFIGKISAMPVRSKIDFCEFVVGWAGQDCCCRYELDDDESSLSNFNEDGEIGSFSEEMGRLGINERSNSNGSCNGNGNVRGSGDFRSCRIPLPWELMQPVLRILGHCLLAPMKAQEVRDAASVAIRSVYARASHELMPQAILASRSLIQLDKSTRKAARDASGMAVIGGMASNPTTPSKPKKPEVLLVSK
ncbi:uncharacterized protein A4U43_C09F9360 [Asparagus officinalis]|uniref:Hyccin n=1 Tax=Asparagus officinalis TaxID=4686 RepID=A0A5P1EB95_ASPOF|nr:uncharacterized protein A4U43_C09F9360 [Asparagus officinalis]